MRRDQTKYSQFIGFGEIPNNRALGKSERIYV